MNTVLRIDQALYGYRNGHRLLQASRKVDGLAERVMLTLSDMSGPRMLEGFEQYLTAYPVPDTEIYAIAKTWYAPEMERPGCVWTHVLLVNFGDLFKIQSIGQLVRSYRRPLLGSLEGYHLPITLDLETSLPIPTETWASQDSADLIRALYAEPLKPTIVGAPSSSTHESLVCAIWAQQWPALRAKFCFCTGALSGRASAGKPFDLQIVPDRLAREMERTPTYRVVGRVGVSAPQDVVTGEDMPAWTIVASENLRDQNQSPFAKFLWDYSEDLHDPRSRFQGLAEIYRLIKEVRGNAQLLTGLTKAVSKHLPSQREGLLLKDSLYGRASAMDLLPAIAEYDRLKELVISPNPQAFDATRLEIRQRSTYLWCMAPDPPRELLNLAAVREHSLASETLTGFSEAVRSDQLCSIVEDQPYLLSIIVASNYRLAMSNDLWSCKVDVETFFDVVQLLQETHEIDLVTWLPAAIRSGTGGLARIIFDRFGSLATAATLEIFNGGTVFLSDQWIKELRDRQDEVVTWVNSRAHEPPTASLALTIDILDLHHLRTIQGQVSWWLTLADSPQHWAQRRTGIVPSFLLSMALGSGRMEVIHLIAATFDDVHTLAGEKKLDDEAWSMLTAHLPKLPAYEEWDRCKALRLGLILHFMQSGWSPLELLRSVTNPDTFRDLVRTGYESFQTKDYIHALAATVRHGLTAASVGQTVALEEEASRRFSPLGFFFQLFG